MSAPIVSGADWFVAKPVLEKSVEWQWSVTALMTVLAIAALIYALKVAKQEHRSHPIAVFVGGILAIFYEPLGDLGAHVAYHEVGQINVITSFGFQIPIWMIPAYALAVSASVVWNMNRLHRGISFSTWMISYGVMIVAAIGFELPLIFMKAIEYYQPQPLAILGYPLWMGCVNAAALMFVPAALAHLFAKTEFGSQRPWLLVLLIPMLAAGAHIAGALPLAFAINSTRESWVINVAAWLSIASALVQVWVVGRLVCQR